jgi:hypothetical protein
MASIPTKESFIYQDKIDPKICKDLIKWFKENKKSAVPGSTFYGVDTKTKDSEDIYVHPIFNDYPFDKYKLGLQKALDGYMKLYPETKTLLARYTVSELFNIQYYKPGGGFKKLHCERSNAGNAKRVLVFMTYLNTVKDAGTEFPNQNFTADCVAGSTLIWPSDWTHSHKGVINMKKEKYIITGWWSFF